MCHLDPVRICIFCTDFRGKTLITQDKVCFGGLEYYTPFHCWPANMNCICNVKNCLSLFSLSTTSSTCVGAAEDHPPWWPTPSCCPASWGPTKLTTTSRTTPTPSATSTSLPASIPTQVHRHTLTCVTWFMRTQCCIIT